MQPNYHTLSNNAVLPSVSGPEEVIHYHSKVTRDHNKPRLAPTLRPGTLPETAQIHDGHINRAVNDSPSMSP